jgi:hypothetical protein
MKLLIVICALVVLFVNVLLRNKTFNTAFCCWPEETTFILKTVNGQLSYFHDKVGVNRFKEFDYMKFSPIVDTKLYSCFLYYKDVMGVEHIEALRIFNEDTKKAI